MARVTGQVRLSHSRRPQEDDVLPTFSEGELCRLMDEQCVQPDGIANDLTEGANMILTTWESIDEKDLGLLQPQAV